MAKSLYIFSSSDHAAMITYYFQQEKDTHVLGYVIDDAFYGKDNFNDLPVQRFSTFLKECNPSKTSIYSAIGYKSMRLRKDIYERLFAAGFNQPSYIHETAFIDPSAKLGRNCFIMPGVVIERNVIIGDNVMVWSNSTICHDTVVGSYCFIAANSVIGGNCKIGRSSFLGFASTIIQNTETDEETLLGAMSLLKNNTNGSGKYIGIPAKKISEHNEMGICVI